MNTIANVNDEFRMIVCTRVKDTDLGMLMLSEQVNHFKEKNLPLFRELLSRVGHFNDFNKANNPYKEHDFGLVKLDDAIYFWKIDYYDENYEYGIDPNDPECKRILTIMVSSEY